jgi:5-methylcytosine-specific restriction endonuclease McrA
MEQSKPCTKCGQIKLFSEFNNRRASPDGKQPKCRDCEKADHRAYNAKNSARNTAKATAWNKANSERRKIITNNYVLRNPEKRRETNKLNHLKNRNKRLIQTKEWRLANMDKARSYVLKRRGLIKSTAKQISIKEINKLYSSSCKYCGSNDKIEIDHIVPLSKGGRHSIGNLAPACRKCNASKGDKFLIEWLR